MNDENIKINRLKKKIEKRDNVINALNKKITSLEHIISTQSITLRKLPIDVEKAVQSALCNVRLIPIHGIAKDDKIIEIKTEDVKKQKTPR